MRVQVRGIVTAAAIFGGLSFAAAAEDAPLQPPPAQPGPAAPSAPRGEPNGQAAPETPKAPAVKPSEAPAAQSLVGLMVFSSDGTRVGEVRSVDTGQGGNIVALRVRTGGFLGFGGRIVAIPEGKFIRSGQSIRIDLDSDEVAALPEVKD
jgi:sporulation protein YlmC with PRC-barrel domain